MCLILGDTLIKGVDVYQISLLQKYSFLFVINEQFMG